MGTMANKYDPVADYLSRQSKSPQTMRFAEIESLIGTPLPASSRKHKAWWSNDRSPNGRHVQAKYGWLAASWEVESLDLTREAVTFRKRADGMVSRPAAMISAT